MQYSEQLKAYHNSTAYQEWIANKGRLDHEHSDDLDKRSKVNRLHHYDTTPVVSVDV